MTNVYALLYGQLNCLYNWGVNQIFSNTKKCYFLK